MFLVLKVFKHAHNSGLPEYKREVRSAPRGWNGPPAVLYRSFDTLTGIKLMEGNSQIDYDALIPGKVNYNLRLATKQKLSNWDQ